MNRFLPLVKKLLANHSSWLIFVFLLAFYVILMINLGRDGLFDWDEGIYGELGRQVVERGEWLTTYWNGEPWLEKPPGIAWLSGFGIALLGPTSAGARFFMPLLAVYVLYIVSRLGTHFGGSYRHGLFAAGILASLDLFLGRTRAVNTDMALLASITTTILFLLENRPSWWVALSIFGGVWFKGIAGLLSVIIALPLIVTKSKRYLVSLLIVSSFLIIPWHLYAYLKHGDTFLTPYFLEQVVRRASVQIEFHFEPRWYYFNYLYENLGLGVLLVAGLGAISAFMDRKKWLLIWWVLAPLAIFTLAKTRLFWYILPIYPALALLTSEIIGRFTTSKLQKNILLILAIGVLLQALRSASASVGISKQVVMLPDRLYVVRELGSLNQGRLGILVPPSERLSEALLPQVARLSSSFRYGGMPSVVFYYLGPVTFYYNVDEFRDWWVKEASPLALIARDDKELVPTHYQEIVTTETYLGIQKGVYAQR